MSEGRGSADFGKETTRAVSRILDIVLLLCLGTLACREEMPFQPPDVLPPSFETEHFIYHVAAGDTVDAVWQEAYYSWVIGELGLEPTIKLHYVKYRDLAHMEGLTGRGCCGFVDTSYPGVLHTIYRRDNHETVHALVIGLVGHPPALFNEGIAVAHHGNTIPRDFRPEAPRISGATVDYWSRRYLVHNRIPSLVYLLPSSGFFARDPEIVYPVAGSFVRFLIDRAGIGALKEFVAASDHADTASATRMKFEAVYGRSLDAWWEDWLGFLAAAPP